MCVTCPGVIARENACAPPMLRPRLQTQSIVPPSNISSACTSISLLDAERMLQQQQQQLSRRASQSSTSRPQRAGRRCLRVSAAGSTYGTNFRVTTFGESHGKGVGCVIDGVPPRLQLSQEEIQVELDRRRPGQSIITTPRKEEDTCEILSGVFDGITLGTPIAVLVRNKDQRSGDYSEMSVAYRPSHADATYDFKYGIRAVAGGGRSSARETIGRVAAGAVAKKLLATVSGTEVGGWVVGGWVWYWGKRAAGNGSSCMQPLNGVSWRLGLCGSSGNSNATATHQQLIALQAHAPAAACDSMRSPVPGCALAGRADRVACGVQRALADRPRRASRCLRSCLWLCICPVCTSQNICVCR